MTDWRPSAHKTPLNYSHLEENVPSRRHTAPPHKEPRLPYTTTTTTSTPSKMSGISKHIPGTKAHTEMKRNEEYNNGSGGGLRDHPTDQQSTAYNRGATYSSNQTHPSARTGGTHMPGSYDDMPSGVEDSVNPSSGAGTTGQTGLRQATKQHQHQHNTPGATGYSSSDHSRHSGHSGNSQYNTGATGTNQYPQGQGATGASQYAPGTTNTAQSAQYPSGTTGLSQAAQYPSGNTGSSQSAQYPSGNTGSSQYATQTRGPNPITSPIDQSGVSGNDARRSGHDDFDTRAAVHQYSTRTHHPDTTPSQLGYGTDGYSGGAGARGGYQETSLTQYGTGNGNGNGNGRSGGYGNNTRTGYQQDLARNDRYDSRPGGQDYYSSTATHAAPDDDRLPPSSMQNMTQSTTTTTPSGYTTTTTTTPHTSKPTTDERQAMAGAMQGASTTAQARGVVKGVQAKTDRLVGGVNRLADDLGERAAQRKYRDSDSSYRTDGHA